MPRTNPEFPRRAPGLIELSVALTALIVSAASLFIARQQTTVMDRQLAATVWPAIQLSTSNLHGGERVIALTLANVGVGPARIAGFRVYHDGHEIPDLTEFIVACCAPEGVPVSTVTSFVNRRILPAGERIDFLTMALDPDHPEVYQRFDRVRGELQFELCYCSVLEECWAIGREATEPQSVRTCE